MKEKSKIKTEFTDDDWKALGGGVEETRPLFENGKTRTELMEMWACGKDKAYLRVSELVRDGVLVKGYRIINGRKCDSFLPKELT